MNQILIQVLCRAGTSYNRWQYLCLLLVQAKIKRQKMKLRAAEEEVKGICKLEFDVKERHSSLLVT